MSVPVPNPFSGEGNVLKIFPVDGRDAPDSIVTLEACLYQGVQALVRTEQDKGSLLGCILRLLFRITDP
jgi:hypothetical protein